MSRTIVDVHLLQTVPPSNLNRDDNGSPKTATYGGVRRARVSSQAWKRATREAFKDHLDSSELGVRTKRVVELIAERILTQGADLTREEALAAAETVLKEAGIAVKEPRGNKGAPAESGYLLFLSAQQRDALAELAAEAAASGEKPDKKAAQALIKGKNSIDLALFGRMVADVTDLNVDASCQVAHALSTHVVETEYDYFTAVDDHKADDAEEDAGAGMIGTVEFNSATLYRYATIDVDLLAKNLGDVEAAERAVRAFLQAFVRSMPTGKQNTFANRTLPDAVVVSVREDQPVSYVGAFEEAVTETLDGGRVRRSAQKLAEHARSVTEAYGGEPVKTWVVGVGAAGEPLEALGERTSFDDAVASVASLVAERLAAGAATSA
ncbi:type I-E CRISPR-associated protein Cas7/Cse4/CasC [Xylanimonas oleitrophica]|uniref:Type I-E CRISPR-associated protein Cas7/Cse4/CasC n=1 Tax=Xylanimonas oleitrophica TaxID=2607479 RepID=A0A2W5WV61_9MICO|nr:type I-E CRISPR-associated protein Cas7/Cse4/CasC [Xylanimonas oleitrophica]PZR51715.1 type I-E CRISPR-associated protein Cas7/Cse4/CasC [Xylanimonas oleitrophica]